MEEEIKTSTAGKKAMITALIVLLTFIIYYAVISMLAPGKKMRELAGEYALKKSDKTKVDEKISSDSTYIAMMKEKSFLRSRILMAETDSIYLTINLPDSVVHLEISGVAVHTSKTRRQRVSALLSGGNELIIPLIFSRPMTIVNDFSSIEKEPLMIKMAPKDTSEFKPDIIPDTADSEPVNFVLEMDNGITLFIYQDERINMGDNLQQFIFDSRYRFRLLISSLKSALRLEVPDYRPFIKIRLARAEAKRIYRALPLRGQVSVFM
jgi:hypothetical protein